MFLNVAERLLLRNIIPQLQGNFDSIREARQVIESLFTEEEGKVINLRVENEQVHWDDVDAAGKPILQEKEVEISEGLTKKIGIHLKLLDRQERLDMALLSLYEKFVGVE